MYRILLKMKKMYNHENWLKMVEQAKERGKLTDKRVPGTHFFARGE
ncbi:MAG: hypothetical protein ACLRW4_11665 [Ruminococcus sp.]